MKRKLISGFLAVWVMCMLPLTAFAQNLDLDRLGSISVTLTDPDGLTPITGAELSLYYVATVSLNSQNRLIYSFTDAFVNCGVALDDPALTTVLNTFVKAHPVSSEKLVTDANGSVTFTNLPLGLYFVQQTNALENYAPCTPFLVTVPHQNAEGYVYDVNASPKTSVAKFTDITIRKVWNTDASTKKADSVTVQLMHEGVLVATAVLNEQNEWQIVYTDMPESDRYTILEVDIPEGFVASYSQKGYIFTVTNTAFLIQTGQLVWPIPVLAMVGLCLITVGTIVLRKTRDKNA